MSTLKKYEQLAKQILNESPKQPNLNKYELKNFNEAKSLYEKGNILFQAAQILQTIEPKTLKETISNLQVESYVLRQGAIHLLIEINQPTTNFPESSPQF